MSRPRDFGYPTDQGRLDLLDAILADARARDYAGPDYADGMSSRWLQALPVDNRWLNLAVQETVKRAPIDLRWLFRVDERRNYKGAALFVMANLNYYLLTGDERTRSDFYPLVEAKRLADWLVDHRYPGYHGFALGHPHPVQQLDHTVAPSVANIVTTSVAVKALLRTRGLDDRFAPIARSAHDFLVHDLDYRTVPTGARIDYDECHSDEAYTLNSAALGAHMLIDLYDHFGDAVLRRQATAILDDIAAQQTSRGGWWYRIPPESSHLSMDNHHNGFILEAYLRYEAAIGDGRFADTIDRGLAFYRSELFDESGAPNFDETSAYPRDVHASAQGILVFSRAGEFDEARRILRWTRANLSAGEGRFYYRRGRYHTKRVVLMRWSQAWMAYAVSELIRRSELPDSPELATVNVAPRADNISAT